MRETGGNRFIAEDADETELLDAIKRGLHDLRKWANLTSRSLDLGAITVNTVRTGTNAISVSVTADLKR